MTSSSPSPPTAQASTSSPPIPSAVSSDPSTSTSVVATALNNAPSKRSGRGYLKFMPQNQFKPKTFKDNGQAKTPTSSKKPRNKQKKKRKGKRPTIYNKSSKKHRMDPQNDVANQEPTRTNKLKPAIITQNCLGRFATITMDCGTLPTQLQRGIETNNIISGTHKQNALRKEQLKHIAYYNKDVFFTNLMQDVFSRHDTGKRAGRPKKDTPANRCEQEIISDYRQFLHEAGVDVPYLKETIKSGLVNDFRDSLQCHFARNISELAERVKEHNSEWSDGEEGRLVLADIDEDGKSRTLGHDPISSFWILNSHLPANKQMRSFPEARFTDKFFAITEAALISALLRMDYEGLLDEVFPSQDEAKDHAAHHPGDLFFRLFFSKSLTYTRGVCLANPDVNIKSERRLLELDSEAQEEYDGLVQQCLDSKDNAYSVAKSDFQEFVFNQIGQPDERRLALNEGSDWRRHVLTGTLMTNGHELKMLGYYLNKAAPPSGPRRAPNTTRGKLKDVRDALGSLEQVESVLGIQESYIIVGIDPGIKNTGTACIIDSNEGHPQNMSISQVSHKQVMKSYRSGLDHAKRKAGIQGIESQIKPIECPSTKTGE
ncbi:hypothetical protein B0O80DRAFT_489520 [Mortierella sp. GBAus27b]|nr:hypothetical protein BGX31_001524 [Mortierella sp. GBA43]KAI8349256.1 hypothetical protein B0O80DRAFT_489520 [Mortierella sp. GBAus27b]